MATVITTNTVGDLSSGGGSYDGGTSPTAIVVLVSQNGAQECTGVTWDGQALTKVVEGLENGFFKSRAQAWVLLAPTNGGTKTVALSGGANGRFDVYGVRTDGPAAIADSGSSAGVADPMSVAIDTASDPAVAFVVCNEKNAGTALTPYASTTEHYDDGAPYDRRTAFGYEASDTTGSRTVGWSDGGYGACVAVALDVGDLDVSPDPVGMAVDLKAGAIGYSGPVSLPGTRVRPLAIDLHAGAISFAASRHVALVGNGLATSEMTDGLRSDGSASQEGDPLTWHTDRKPSFDAPAGGVDWRDPTTRVTDLSVSGAKSIDRDTAATHDLTLTGDTTLTPTDTDPPGAGHTIDLRAVVRQDGTGGHTLALGGTIAWAGGSAPAMPTAANAVLTLGFLSVDDGTTWLGFAAAGSSVGTPATTVESETSFGISAAVGTDTEYARQDHTHGTPTAPVTAAAVQAVGHYELLMTGSSPPEPLEDGTGEDWLYVWVNP